MLERVFLVLRPLILFGVNLVVLELVILVIGVRVHLLGILIV